MHYCLMYLTLKASGKGAFEGVICRSRLLQIVAWHFWPIKCGSKQPAPGTGCSYSSSLIWVHTVCHRGVLNISADGGGGGR